MKARLIVWLGVFGVAIVAGVYTWIQLLTRGHILFNANDVVIWTLPIGSYVFFALTSSGLGLLSALPLLFGAKSYEPVAKRIVYLAIATLVAAFVSIGLELGSLAHIIYIFLSPNFGSPIQIMGMIYSAELVFLLLKFQRMHVGDLQGALSKISGVGSFVCALFGPLVLGSVFGITESRPTFFGSFLPVLSLVVAIVSGLAAFVFYSSLLRIIKATQLGQADESSLLEDASRKFGFMVFIALMFYALWAVYRSATTLPNFATDANFSAAFILLLPLIMMLNKNLRSSVWSRIVASVISLVTFFWLHMEVILAGQIRPMGPKAEGLPQVLSYSPSIWEYLVVIFAAAVMLLLFTLGEKLLRLEPQY